MPSPLFLDLFNRISLVEFQQLPDAEQLEHLEERGIFLDVSRWTDRHQINLFFLDGFYVEVYYHAPTDTLVRFDGFSDYERLDPFLGQIDIFPVFARL